jgi:hypothetical protein
MHEIGDEEVRAQSDGETEFMSARALLDGVVMASPAAWCMSRIPRALYRGFRRVRG